MPDLTSTTVAANYNQPKTNNGLGPRTVIIKVAKTDLTTAELHTIIRTITAGGTAGTQDAFTVAGIATATGTAFVSGTTDVVFVALQGTGVVTAIGSNAYGVAGAVTTVESVFVNPF